VADHARAARLAGELAAGRRPVPPQLRAALAELGEAYLELARAARSQPRQIYVTLAAAHEYARAIGAEGIEDARRELTELLLQARPKMGDPSRWRLREPDLSARVAIDEKARLAVVTHIHLRDRHAGRRER
jgi:hypothetical protein